MDPLGRVVAMRALRAVPISAHFGHWWTSLLYLVPIVVIVCWLSFTQWRENRDKDRKR